MSRYEEIKNTIDPLRRYRKDVKKNQAATRQELEAFRTTGAVLLDDGYALRKYLEPM